MTSEHKRHERDFYETPSELVQWMVKEYVDRHEDEVVLEPGCGSSPFLRCIRDTLDYSDQPWEPKLIGVDIEPQDSDTTDIEVITADFLDFEPHEQPDLIIGNPPYKGDITERFVEKAFEIAADYGTIVFLSHLGFLGSKRRQSFFEKYPPYMVTVLSPRPRFIKGSKSPMLYDSAIFEWHKNPGYQPATEIEWRMWK